MISSLTVLVPIFILWTSCDKPESSNDIPEHLKVNSIIKEYFGSYGVGSWWRYEVENSSNEEFCEVTIQPYSTLQTDPPVELLNLLITSNLNPDLVIENSGDNELNLIRTYFKNTSYQLNFFFNGQNFYAIDTVSYAVEHLDTLTVLNTTYNDLVYIARQNAFIREVWVANGVGIVRKNINNEIYNLSSSQIIQP